MALNPELHLSLPIPRRTTAQSITNDVCATTPQRYWKLTHLTVPQYMHVGNMT